MSKQPDSEDATASHEATEHGVNRSNETKGSVSSSIATLVVRLLGIGIQFGVYYLVTQWESIDAVANYALAASLWLIARVLGPRGYESVLLRELSRHGHLLAWLERKVLRSSFQVGLLGGGMVSIVVVAGLFPNTDASAFLPALAAIPLHAILGVQTTGLRARGRAGLAQFAESVVLPLTTCVMLTLGHVISGWSELGILQAAFLGILMATLVNASLLRRTSYLERCGADIPVPNAEVLRRASSVLFVGLVASTLCTRAPTIVLARLGSPEEVAVFDAALRIASLGTLILWAIRISFSPQFSRLAAAGDYMGLRRVVRIASTLAGGAAMLCLLMFVILGPWLLGAFGEVYLDAWVPLLILSGSLGLNCLLGLCGTALIMAGHESFVVKVSFLQLFVLLILTPLLLPAYGVIGMVSSMAMALLIRDLTALIKFVLVTSRGRLTAVEADAGATSLR